MNFPRIGRRIGLTCLALTLAACGHSQSNGEESYNLPGKLTEASGLAVAGPDSVFTHNDEFAIIYEFRLTDGKVLRAFALGDPTLEGDFEGIATGQGRVFLVTSDGLIYSVLPGKDGKRVPYRVYDSGIGPRCEIEGLSQGPETGELLLLCKRFRNDNHDPLLEIYRWRIGAEHAEEQPFLSLPLDPLLDKDERAEFRPSGLDYDPSCQQLYIVSARNRMVLVLDKAGEVLGHRTFKKSRHPQAEGIAVMPDGRLVLADEGSRSRKGRLTIYDKNRITDSCGTP
jgi:uncharacterized protein YjiK